MKRVALVVSLVATICALRAIPAAPARAGGLCSLPVIGALCSVVSGVTDGVSWTVDTGTGLVKDAAGKVIAKVADKLGTLACVTTAEATTDGIATPLAGGFCSALVGKLAALVGKKATPGGSSTAGGSSPPTTTPSAASTDPPDTPAHYLSTSALAAGAALFLDRIGSEIGKATSVDLTGGWFHDTYGRAVALASAIMLAAFLLACVEGSVRSDSAMLLLALQALPRAAVLGAAGAALIGAGVAFTDQAGVAVAGPDMHTATHALHLLALAFVTLGVAAKAASGAGHSAFASILGAPAALFAGFAFLGSLAMVSELIVRAIGIYAASLFVPVTLAASVWPRFAEAPKRLAVTLSAIIASKFVLVCVLALSAGAMTGGGVRGIAVGCGLLMIAAVAPWAFYKFFTVADHHFTRTAVVPSGALGGPAMMLSSIAYRSEQVSRAHGVPSPQSQSPRTPGEQGEQSVGDAATPRMQSPRTIDTQGTRKPPDVEGEEE